MMSLREFTAELGARLGLPMVCHEMPDDRVQIDLQDDPEMIYTCDRTMPALIKAEMDLAMRAKALNVVTVH